MFYKSGWTQEELARKEGKSRTWLVYQLTFGRFLDFTPSGRESQIPPNLTERKFRSCWEQTDKSEKNERIRFKQVVELLGKATLHLPPRAARALPGC